LSIIGLKKFLVTCFKLSIPKKTKSLCTIDLTRAKPLIQLN